MTKKKSFITPTSERRFQVQVDRSGHGAPAGPLQLRLQRDDDGHESAAPHARPLGPLPLKTEQKQ